MRTIYRYVLGRAGDFHRGSKTVILRLPINARILTVKLMQNEVSVYAVVDTERDTELRTFRIFGTGHDANVLTYEDIYIGSISVLNETYMYHIFDSGLFDRSKEQHHGNDQSTRPNQEFVARL